MDGKISIKEKEERPSIDTSLLMFHSQSQATLPNVLMPSRRNVNCNSSIYKTPSPVKQDKPQHAVNLLYMEDFDPLVDPGFIKQILRPYFKEVFADICLRSTRDPAAKSGDSRSIDKVTFVEYVNLPGIVSDRFHALAADKHPDGRVSEQSFIDLLLQVFGSSVETKMRMTFKL